jgi:uncharacterized protein
VVQIAVRVIPRSSKPGIAGTRGGALLVRLQSAPVEGAANVELIQILSDALDVPRRSISIVSGEHSRLKHIRVEGVAEDYVNSKFKTQNANNR